MKRGNTNFMSGPRITAGDTVTLTNCCIGTEIENVYDPVYAKNQLKINNSRIYQTIQSHITDSTATAPIGTASGKTEINQSVIKTAASNTGYIKDLYTGTLYIKDAASDVTIAGSQIVEISNGAITPKFNIINTSYSFVFFFFISKIYITVQSPIPTTLNSNQYTSFRRIYQPSVLHFYQYRCKIILYADIVHR